MDIIYFYKLFNNYIISYAILGIIILLITIYLLKKYIVIANKFKIIDLPNYRSSHKLPTIRGGGVIIAIVSQLTIVFLYKLKILPPNIAFAYSCGFMLAILGFIDDLINLSIKIRLFFQCIISCIAIFFVLPTPIRLPISIHYISQTSINDLNNLFNFITSLFLLIWSINLFNFMDGTDGLAGVEATFVVFLGGILVYLATKSISFSGYLWLISFIILGFLKFNWPPAKVFMGDVGSYFLGFFIGISSLISHYIYKVSLCYWLILYAVFLVDATLTLIKRMIYEKEWYKSHRQHAYQKMQNLGWQHKKILYGLIIINSLLGCIALFAFYKKLIWINNIIVYLLLGTLYLYIEYRLKRKIHEKNS